jgi:hypothetical protein
MSLTTPDNIRTLQRKLYLKAKAEPNYRFYLLYDKIYRADILRHAYDLVRANKGAPGVDGVDCAAIEAAPSVPMKMRHLPPGNLHLRARKDHLRHAHASEAPRGSRGRSRPVRRPSADARAGSGRGVT